MTFIKDENGIIKASNLNLSKQFKAGRVFLYIYGQSNTSFFTSYNEATGVLRLVSEDGGWERELNVPCYILLNKFCEDLILVNYLHWLGENLTISHTIVGQKDYLVLRDHHDEGTEVYLLIHQGEELEIYHISQDLGDPLYNLDEAVVQDWVLSKTQ